jgi:magnesium-transporting ATPase (P-type)
MLLKLLKSFKFTKPKTFQFLKFLFLNKQRLSPKCATLFEISEDHLNKFAEDALRTLCLAWKEIKEDEYAKWSQLYHQASTSLENRAEKVSQVYELIETNLLFAGATAIEDKLQDGVPECIAKLAKANIKIWVLTGDKLETAINIGYSCQLLTNDMDVYTIEANSEEELINQLKEKRKMIEHNQNRIMFQEEKSKYQQQQQQQSFLLNNSNLTSSPFSQQMSPNSQSYNMSAYSRPDSSGIFSTYSNERQLHSISFQPKEVSEKQILTTIVESNLSGSALVINGQSLVYALTDKCEKEFLDIACMCKAVICCRVTPGQKKAVVDLVKTHKKAITLAVGDGANDVSMIKCTFFSYCYTIILYKVRCATIKSRVKFFTTIFYYIF